MLTLSPMEDESQGFRSVVESASEDITIERYADLHIGVELFRMLTFPGVRGPETKLKMRRNFKTTQGWANSSQRRQAKSNLIIDHRKRGQIK